MGPGRIAIAAALVLVTASACAGNAGTPAAGPALSTGATSATHPATATVTPATTAVTPTRPASPDATTPVPVPAGPASTVPIAALPPAPWTNVPQRQIDLSRVTSNPPDMVATTENGTVVVFGREMGGCQRLDAQVTEQSATTVGLLAITISSSTAGQMCPMLVREVQAAVKLSAPLGNRVIVFTTATKHS